jgi:hypothetical protein
MIHPLLDNVLLFYGWASWGREPVSCKRCPWNLVKTVVQQHYDVVQHIRNSSLVYVDEFLLIKLSSSLDKSMDWWQVSMMEVLWVSGYEFIDFCSHSGFSWEFFLRNDAPQPANYHHPKPRLLIMDSRTHGLRNAKPTPTLPSTKSTADQYLPYQLMCHRCFCRTAKPPFMHILNVMSKTWSGKNGERLF